MGVVQRQSKVQSLDKIVSMSWIYKSGLTSRQIEAKAYTSLYVVMGGMAPSSSTSARISSGAIQRVDPAKKDVPRVIESDISSMTFERPKSVMMALPVSSTRMFPWTNNKGGSKCRGVKCTNPLQISVDDGRLYRMQVRDSRCNLNQLGERIRVREFWLIKYLNL